MSIRLVRCHNCKREYEAKGHPAQITRQKWCSECYPAGEVGARYLREANKLGRGHQWTREEAILWGKRGRAKQIYGSSVVYGGPLWMRAAKTYERSVRI
jgi:hypothetical protein